METRLNTLHEAHIGEPDIPLVLSQLKVEARELWVLLGLPSPDMQGLITNLEEEGFDDEDEKGEEIDPDSSAPSTTNDDLNSPYTSASKAPDHSPSP